ncbi:amidohydrolase [candidate division KSB1 bacterium]|nr:amidohydrolase [candidate division KSB1 bacterium]
MKKTPRLSDFLVSHFSDDLKSHLLALRRDLHQHPELSFQEHRTAQKLYDELAQLPVQQLEHVAGTGVIARIKGRNSRAPVVAIRGDIDALPIQEATDLEYASVNPGVMHACGHDVHATWTIGAAHLLAANPAAGDVMIILQPAEEIGKGALAILENGVLEGVQAIIGGHVDRRFQVGQVVAEAGALAASADEFKIELIGSGSHGARPHEAADPIVGAAALISALQTIVSRRLNPAKAGVVSVGTMRAGSAANIIPERAQLTGTLRALDAETRQLLHDEVRRLATAIAQAYGLLADVEIILGTPVLNNSSQAANWARQAVSNILREEALAPLGSLNLAGEDFAFYLEKMAGCFLRIGACEPGGKFVAAHAPHFYVAEESIFIGAAVLAETARVASAALSQVH